MAGGMPAFKVHVSGADGPMDAAQILSNKERKLRAAGACGPQPECLSVAGLQTQRAGLLQGGFPHVAQEV